MCSVCCAVGVVGEYREHYFILAIGVVSRTFGKLGREERR